MYALLFPERYTQVAEIIRAIFREYDPRMRSYSLDEAYLNVTQALVNRLKDSTATPVTAAATAAVEATAAMAAEAEASPGTKQEGPGRSVHNVGFGHPATASDGKGLSTGAGTTLRRRGEGLGMTRPATARDEEDEDEEDGEDGGGGRGGYGSEDEMPGKTSREEHRARLFEAARCLAEEIRGRIKEATKLTASVGIGPNFMLAKVRMCRSASGCGCALNSPRQAGTSWGVCQALRRCFFVLAEEATGFGRFSVLIGCRAFVRGF